ncbi:MAG: anaerobic ribonucleoside-triphosphate reductase activating protein [Proteobacteria bacterium]|nr:anaerobic ribonucleoside-triphosphate reductase activating protein [Pseudomonadota bacterium]MBU1739304.1 anaerobic ribonucleoside-triphosphate reductase activating protein [Pseudomonadota bacterium]
MSFKNIKGFIDTSFIDWPGRSCAVLFLAGCNFRCPFCHNHPLVVNPGALTSFTLTDILEQLKPLRKWLGGICVSGGEPTLDPDLRDLLQHLHGEGFELKIDTNGSNPDILQSLLEQNLVQMISMDVKTVFVQQQYDTICGTHVDLEKIKQSIRLIKKSGIDHEFRITVIPAFHTKKDIAAWVEQLGTDSVLKLQNYKPDSVMNPDLSGMNVFSPDQFRDLENIVESVSRDITV